jgi:hypothetical protein
MNSSDRALSMMLAVGLVLGTACGGEAPASDVDDLEAGSLATVALGEGDGEGSAAVTPSEGGLVEKATGGVLSGSPSFIDFGTGGVGESISRLWVISATRRTELVTAVSVEPFTVSPIGCAVIEPSDPSLRRCVFTITFSPPGEAGTYEATLGASDLDGNLTTVDVVGVGEAFLP